MLSGYKMVYVHLLHWGMKNNPSQNDPELGINLGLVKLNSLYHAEDVFRT